MGFIITMRGSIFIAAFLTRRYTMLAPAHATLLLPKGPGGQGDAGRLCPVALTLLCFGDTIEFIAGSIGVGVRCSFRKMTLIIIRLDRSTVVACSDGTING